MHCVILLTSLFKNLGTFYISKSQITSWPLLSIMVIPYISAGLNTVTAFILPLINRLLITSGSDKSMMCCSLGPLLTSWNLLGPCSSEVQLKTSGAAGGVGYLIADSWSQNRIVMVTHHGVSPQNDTVTRASGRVLGCCEPAVNVLRHISGWLWFYWLTWGHL